MTAMLKRAYVNLAEFASPIADRIILRNSSPDFRSNKARHWLASLFAIHNFDRLVALDVPWWTYRSIEEVEDFLDKRPMSRVFEWGSGASTVWLAKRSAEVVSIEHDAQWFEYLDSKSKHTNVSSKLVRPAAAAGSKTAIGSGKPGAKKLDFSGYVHAIDAYEGQFDLIVIDGRARTACLWAAIPRLKDDGVILFDNSGRQRYREAIETCGLYRADFAGLTPCLPYPDQTTLLSRKE